jgi:hypothetical protein
MTALRKKLFLGGELKLGKQNTAGVSNSKKATNTKGKPAVE